MTEDKGPFYAESKAINQTHNEWMRDSRAILKAAGASEEQQFSRVYTVILITAASGAVSFGISKEAMLAMLDETYDRAIERLAAMKDEGYVPNPPQG